MTELKLYPDKKICGVSPLLYGIFFEDINYGGDGGLYAELVANRSFDYYDRDNTADLRAMCWDALKGTGFSVNEKNSAVINGGKNCGIRNRGFCGEGIFVRRGEEFVFSCRAYAGNKTKLAAVLADRTGAELARAEFRAGGGVMTEYKCTLKSNAECSRAFLYIILPDGGGAELDFVSLFPKNAVLGLFRADLAERLKELSPKFMRFPGGCIVEGRSFENMYNWKETIGPVHERRTNWNRWQMEEYQLEGRQSDDYFQSYGLGFYEYFLLCEYLGAEPVPVINCGMTCQWHEGLLVEPDKLSPFIKDAEELIEFANGGRDSEWGKKRADMGHPEPFGLKYMGIGNEQWGAEYFKRYELFERSLKKTHPEIKLITSAGWKDSGEDFDFAYSRLRQNKDMAYAVDEHFYKEPEWFFGHTDRYDGYDRTLPKVFIGEYAAHTSGNISDRRNNWYAALSEAAFLTGVERNGDHVVMACYAPLFGRIGHSQWQPNLIWFDKSASYGTPSFFVQKLFAEFLPDSVIAHECGDGSIKISAGIKAGKLIVKLVNISGEEKSVALPEALCGARVTELFGNPGDENSVSETKISPAGYTLSGNTVSLKPYSVTVCF